MYLKRLFKTVVLKAFLWRRRKKINWNLKAWNSITKHRFQDWRLMEYLQELGVDTLSSVAAIIDSRFPEFQELDLWPRRTPQDMTGTLEVDVLYSILELLILPWVKKQMTHQALPPALLLGTWRPKFLSRPSVQTDNTPSKVNYGTCHFPKCLTFHFYTSAVHTLFTLEMHFCGSSPGRSLPFHKTKMLYNPVTLLILKRTSLG